MTQYFWPKSLKQDTRETKYFQLYVLLENTKTY